ncbi:MAG: 4Fe-4S binding protein [Candidatus Bathyarchaeia archaeon]
MKQLTVLSGKGGTGKTSITASIAALANNPVIADCDVDAPDLHMLLHPETIETQQFKGPQLAEIDLGKCIKCGLCQKACRFEAITDFKVDAMRCEGCGTCMIVCPENAIRLKERISGQAFISKTKYGMMSHALLFPGESNSGKLVTLVRHNARQIAEKEKNNLILIDGPPGLGCAVIASVTGIDVGVIVTEPTVSGIHDMKRVLKLLDHFNVLSLVCINKHDINKENTRKIERFCRKQKIRVVGKISFDPIVTEAMVIEKSVVDYSPENIVSQEIREMWDNIRRLM